MNTFPRFRDDLPHFSVDLACPDSMRGFPVAGGAEFWRLA